MKSLIFTFSIILLFVFSIGFVYAQEQNNTENADVEKLLDNGNTLFKSGKYQEALK
ncbi:MAG: hypothetical protein ACPKPY_03070 [Nitrososphaeraceae archaeon]